MLHTAHCRDYMMQPSDIDNVAASIDGARWRFHKVDAESVRLWTQRYPGSCFIHQSCSANGGSDFILGIQDPDQHKSMQQYGNGRPVFLDTTHGTNKNKVRSVQRDLLWSSISSHQQRGSLGGGSRHPGALQLSSASGFTAIDPNNNTLFLFGGLGIAGNELILAVEITPYVDLQFPLATALVLDEHYEGVPAAWGILQGERSSIFVRWLGALKECMAPDWRPSCFIVDDCDAEINAIRQALPIIRGASSL